MNSNELPASLAQENVALALSWDRHTPEHLENYLVSEVEDPRINCQSILTRSLIIDTLWPGEFTSLIDEDLRFGTVLTWLFNQLKSGTSKESLLTSIQAADESVPTVVSNAYNWLQQADCPVPDYISDALFDGDTESQEGLTEMAMDVFSTLWQCELNGREADSISLLEPACGSANDFRYFEPYGLEPHIKYSGFDISTKNIENARNRFTDIDFRVLSAFDTGLEDDAYDFLLVHDLFEHLSPAGIETSMKELLRVTKKQAWLHFFNMDGIAEHDIRPTEHYHWNLLSEKRIVDLISPYAEDIQITPISTLLEGKFGFNGYYNKQACSMVVTLK